MNGAKLGANAKKAVLKRNLGELSATVNGETISWKLIPTAVNKTGNYNSAKPAGPASRTSARSSVPNKY